MKKIIFTISFLFCAFCFIFAQQSPYPRGDVFDKAQYERATKKAVQASRAYEALPSSVSLKKYAPTAGNQGAYGTCVGWSTAFTARTISESLSLHRTNKNITDNSVFSPAFLYKSISEDPTCQSGITLYSALELLKTTGVPRMKPTEKTDFGSVPVNAFKSDKKYTIADFATLISFPPDYDISAIDIIKKSLYESKPVLISILCPPSFYTATDVWQPSEDPKENHGSHALTVIGYDDNKAGGSFEIQNSWGIEWGNEGCIWIQYDTFIKFTNGAYEIIDNLATYGELAEFSGSVKIELSNDKSSMPVTFKNGYYETINEYQSGTRFRYLIGNDKPAYIYAFAGDDTANETTMIFPYRENISPILDYSDNLIAFPSDKKLIQLDNVSGTDYLIVLYSKEALDINTIRKNFEKTTGTFSERVAHAVGENFIPYNRATYNRNEIKFNAKSANTKAVFGLLLAIKHR